jgi:hypothetical protein
MRARNVAYGALVLVLALLHFHRPEIFHRGMLTFDDQRFIAPLRGMSFGTYFTQWMPGYGNYAYPLRDLTYFLDFALEARFGFPFLWISNFVFFAIALRLLFRIAERVFGDSARWGWALLAFASLHPMTVEVVQWASIRKHILVAMFIAWGTDRAFALRTSGERPRTRDWSLMVGCYVASLLCWPTGALWIFWLFWFFRDELKAYSARAYRLGAMAVIPLLTVLTLVTLQSHDYREKLAGFLDPAKLASSTVYLLESLGRGAFNLLLPVRIVPYYAEHDWRNWVGLALIAGFIYVATGAVAERARAARKKKTKRAPAVEPPGIPARELLLLAAALFAPNAFIYFTPGQMLWADRYVYVALPYFLFGVGKIWYRPELARWVALLACMLGLSGAELVRWWQDDLALMKRCAEVEGSARCRLLSIEKAFDRGGCPETYPLIEAHRQAYLDTPVEGMDPAFKNEFPTYEAFCLATMNRPDFEAQAAEIEALERRYPNARYAVYFSEVLVRLRRKDVAGAYRKAGETYLLHPELLNGADAKIFNMLRGQVEALCALQPASTDECRRRQRDFEGAVAGAERLEHQVHWGYSQSLAPFLTAEPSARPSSSGRE